MNTVTKLKDGVFEENSRFVAYDNGVVVGKAHDYRGAERHYEKAKGTYVPRRKGNTEGKVAACFVTPAKPFVAPELALPTPSAAAYVPAKDDNFVPFGEFKDINTIVASGQFFPVFITGPTGNGKSTMVEQACARNKREYIRLQITEQTDEDQLIGSKTLVDGNIEIIEGPVLLAMRAGAVLLLDEIDLAAANSIMSLQSILEGKPYYFKLKNEMIVPTPGFNIIATGNTKGRGSESGKYIGTKMLNEAFLERFPVTMQQAYPDMRVEAKIVDLAMQKYGCVDAPFAETLVKWSDAIRRTFEDGALDDLITTRRLIQIVHSYSIFQDKEKAVSLACNRFDSMTKATFVSLFEKLSPVAEPLVQEAVPIAYPTAHPGNFDMIKIMATA